jgi:hypothetical protein
MSSSRTDKAIPTSLTVSSACLAASSNRHNELAVQYEIGEFRNRSPEV